jgi:hypothetical protein
MATNQDSNGIEIDHGDADVSAAVWKGAIDLAIGEEFGPKGYARYLEFRLTLEEATALYDWLGGALTSGRVTWVGP